MVFSEVRLYMQVKEQSRTYSFSKRNIDELNILSADCLHSISVNMCNNGIDKYLKRADYT